MKQKKFIYKVAKSMEDMVEILNRENTDKLLANIVELHEIFCVYLIVWED